MSEPTNPTLAELDAAVDEALTKLARELPRATSMSMVARIGDAASALITAAEARGAARERLRVEGANNE
jgi:hypothetical protein